MYRLVFFCGQGLSYITKRISDLFWQKYLVAYCQKKRVQLSDRDTIRFSGKTLLSISEGACVKIGRNVVINSSYHTINPSLTKITVAKDGELTIGDNSGLSSSVIICKKSVTLGDNVNIGAGCLILDTNMHSTDWRIRADRNIDIPENAQKAPVVIEDNVFIGARSIICKGVIIGRSSMIAAGSVVVKDIPANCIAGGNPCKVIKYLDK